LRLKLDENLGGTVARLLGEAGHDVATVPGQGLGSAPDEQVIGASRTEGRCFVTMDLDFGNPIVFRHSDYPGVALIRLPPRPSPEDLLSAARTLVGVLEREPIHGKLWIVQPGRVVRVYTGDEP